VKAWDKLPIISPRVAETNCETPIPIAPRHVKEDVELHDVVRQLVAPRRTEAVGSYASTKLNPVKVMLARPLVALFTGAMFVNTAVS
jgi:hypothetical protein